MNRNLLTLPIAAALATVIAMSGCGRKTDTHDPDAMPKSETEVVDETMVTEPDEDTGSGTVTPGTPDSQTPDSTMPGTAPPDSSPAPTTGDSAISEGEVICNAEWFSWVNQRVMSEQTVAIAEQYPSGLPEVGSDEWFIAMDKLTGGDGAHGPDGGSDEWCFMIQQRLNKND